MLRLIIPTNRNLILLISLLSCSGLKGWGQEAWSLDACIRQGIERNLDVKNSRLDTRIAREDQLGAIGNFLPQVSANGDWGKRLGRSIDPENNMYTSSAFVESNLGLNVSLPLFTGFTRVNQLKFARLNRQISVQDARIRENDVAYAVMDAFYKLCFERKMSSLATEQRRLSERYLEQMVEYVELGMRSSSELQEVKARFRSDCYQEAVRENNVVSADLYLKELLNLAEKDSLRIAYDVDEATLPPVEIDQADEVYARSEAALPQFEAMRLREKAARKAVAIAAGTFSPTIHADFSLYSGYYDTRKNEAGEIIPFGEQLRNNQNKYIGLRFSFPLFTGLSRFTTVRKERLRLKKVRNDVSRQELTLYAEIEDACNSLRAAIEEHRHAVEALEAERLSLEENQQKWEEGLVSIFELMEKRNRYITAKAELVRTRLQFDLKFRTIRFYRDGSFLPLEN